MTDEQLAQAVAFLLPSEVEVLRLGPTEDPDDCRVCEAFDVYIWGGGYGPRSAAQRRRERIVFALHDWHKGWDLKRAEQRARKEAGLGEPAFPRFMLGRGPECYARCLAIYRAAGWTE